jgi:hypothetical protein
VRAAGPPETAAAVAGDYAAGGEADQTKWSLNGARAINDRGQILAFAFPTNDFDSGAVRAVLLTPVPEPGQTALILIGLGAVALLRRRRR